MLDCGDKKISSYDSLLQITFVYLITILQFSVFKATQFSYKIFAKNYSFSPLDPFSSLFTPAQFVLS